MNYLSSRGKCIVNSAAEAIKMGLSADGGLFVPEVIPVLDDQVMTAMGSWDYRQKASYIMGQFLPDFSDEQIKSCVYQAYNKENFDHESIAPLVKLYENTYIQELWHGPTCAFKDMALQILPHLLTASTRITGDSSEIIILVATSGDTGKAALEGFKDVEGTRIMVFFPRDGVSEIQKQQMVTQEGNNVRVVAVKGNFDDAQTGVKAIFNDADLSQKLARQNIKLSSANSINWGRLLPQIVYYIFAYTDLRAAGNLQPGEPINIVVPTGNFGNILAAYYASRMGVPINQLVCASNANNVLTDFIQTGVYNRNRRFEKTISPSMDILISSNLERLLYEITERDSEKVVRWMESLAKSGSYEIDSVTWSKLQEKFWAGFCTDEDTLKTIGDTWKENKYLLDTHTAVAVKVYNQYRASTGDNTATIIASTASPFKFGSSVASAVLGANKIEGLNEYQMLDKLSEYTGVPIPNGIQGLEKRKVRHHSICTPEDMKKMVLDLDSNSARR